MRKSKHKNSETKIDLFFRLFLFIYRKMSFIEGIGDDLLYAIGFLLFIGIIFLSWLSTHVNHIHLPTTLFVIERRTYRRNGNISIRINGKLIYFFFIEEESERVSSINEQSSSLIEHESDIEYV